MGDPQEMVRQAKNLAEATSALVNAIRRDAENESDPDARQRLLDAAKSLADATSKMVEAAKMAAKNPNVRERERGRKGEREGGGEREIESYLITRRYGSLLILAPLMPVFILIFTISN